MSLDFTERIIHRPTYYHFSLSLLFRSTSSPHPLFTGQVKICISQKLSDLLQGPLLQIICQCIYSDLNCLYRPSPISKYSVIVNLTPLSVPLPTLKGPSNVVLRSYFTSRFFVVLHFPPVSLHSRSLSPLLTIMFNLPSSVPAIV